MNLRYSTHRMEVVLHGSAREPQFVRGNCAANVLSGPANMHTSMQQSGSPSAPAQVSSRSAGDPGLGSTGAEIFRFEVLKIPD